MNDYNYWIKELELIPHPEGGYYKETGESEQTVYTDNGHRSLNTSCLFLLTNDNPSHLHRLTADEMWFYHAGEPLTVHCIHPDGRYEAIEIGPDVHKGQKLSWNVPAGTIFGSSVETNYALVSCVVSPGFTFDDFELFSQEDLISLYPQHIDIIKRMAYS